MNNPDPRNLDSRPGQGSSTTPLIAGLVLFLGYFIMARDLNFFIPAPFTYLGGPAELVPISGDLTRSWLRHFSPPFLASMFWKLFLLLPATLLISLHFSGQGEGGLTDTLPDRFLRIRRMPWLLAAFSLVLILILTNVVFQRTYVTDDENAYVFQARILEAGRITAPAPPVEKSFDNTFIITSGRYTGKYTLGFPAVIALGHRISGSDRFLPVLLALLSIPLLAALGRWLYGAATALTATAFLALSPLFLFNASTLLSHGTTLFFLCLFAVLYFRGLDMRSWTGLPAGLCAGLAVGMAFNIRQLTAIGFGTPFAFYLLFALFKRPRNHAWFAGGCIAGFAVMAGVTLWYNRLISGSPFVFPFNFYDPLERLGFGAMLDGLHYTHTPVRAVQNLLVSAARANLWFLGMPLSLGFLSAFFIFRGERRTGDRWCLAILASYVLWWFLYYSPGVPDTGPVYYFELLPVLCLLSARGVLMLHERFGRIQAGWGRRFVPVFVGVSIATGLVTFYPETALHISAMTEKLGEPYRVAAHEAQTPAVIFIRSLPRVGWVFGWKNTDPFLKGPVIYCRELGPPRNARVVNAFPGRHYYTMTFDVESGCTRLAPCTEKMLNEVPPEGN